jgi:hypothetical protein
MEAVWEAGTPEDPVQRWVVYSATPAHLLTEFQRDEIEARNLSVLPPGVGAASPLAIARAVECAVETVPYAECPQGRLRALAFWEVHRALLLPVWVVQGEGGGHPYRYADHEKRLLRLAQLPDREPELGGLPFAPLDDRVLWRLLALDRLRTRYGDKRRGEGTLADEQGREWRRRFLEFVVAGNTDALGQMSDILARCGLVGDGGAPLDGDAEAKYLESGTFT